MDEWWCHSNYNTSLVRNSLGDALGKMHVSVFKHTNIQEIQHAEPPTERGLREAAEFSSVQQADFMERNVRNSIGAFVKEGFEEQCMWV